MLVICSNHEIILRITWRLDSSGAVLNDEFDAVSQQHIKYTQTELENEK